MFVPHTVTAPLVGVIGSMAWRFDDGHLQLAWFQGTDRLDRDVEHGQRFTLKPFESYEHVRGRVKLRERRRRAAQRMAA